MDCIFASNVLEAVYRKGNGKGEVRLRMKPRQQLPSTAAALPPSTKSCADLKPLREGR